MVVSDMKLLYLLVPLLVVGLVAGYTMPATMFKGNVNMTNKNIVSLATPVNDTDAATKAYADSIIGGDYLPLSGGTLTGWLNLGSFPLQSVGTPSNDSDASTKKYVDDVVSPLASTSDLWDKVNKSGDTMDSGASLTFQDGLITGSGGISFNGTAPTVTNGVLYNDSGTLKFDGSAIGSESSDGWVSVSDTWTYASADDPAFTFTVTGDKTSDYQPGDRLKLTQTTAKYFIVTKVSYSDPTTTITVYGGTDYNLVDAAITSPCYSKVKSPQGFPLAASKWKIVTVDTTNRTVSATKNVWNNVGSVSIVLPIGSWDVRYKTTASIHSLSEPGPKACFVTLSSSSSSSTDGNFTTYQVVMDYDIVMFRPYGASSDVTTASKTTYYLNMMTPYANCNLNEASALASTRIEATCSYL